jgi:hypothetical protein
MRPIVIPSGARNLHLTCRCLVALLLGMTAVGRAQQVQSGIALSRDTVTIGEPFEVRVRVRAPAGSQIRFPENPDSASQVQARDPRSITTNDSVQFLDQTATYRLAAWDIGAQPIVIGNVTVALPASDPAADRTIALSALQVFVRSVLPADSALRVPKPARELWEPRMFPWWIVAAIAVAIALGLLLWWWIRRRRRPAPAVQVDPYVRAQREFNRLELMGLVDAGERTRFVALAVEVLRDYLAARHDEASLALTSREVVSALRRRTIIPHEQLVRVLHEADLAKFAAFSLTEDRARALARDARSIVEHEHTASAPVVEAEPAAA